MRSTADRFLFADSLRWILRRTWLGGLLVGLILLCLILLSDSGLGLCCSAAGAAEKDVRFDVILQGGTVVDGTGRAARKADVGLRNGRIAAIGPLTRARARERIDVGGTVISPGFIDLHSHADRGILRFRSAENYIRQGATTLVCGNCGSSPTDVAKFFADLRQGGIGLNLALLIGHGSVRQQVIGRRNAPPSAAELAEMKRLVRAAMEAGAVGMSTSLRYGPGAYARTNEVVAMAKVVAPFGGFYATHMRDEGTQILEAVEEALQIGREAGVPVHISHHKISSASVFGLTRLTLARIDKARRAGVDVSLDQYPYAAGSGGLSLYVPQASLAGGLKAFKRRVGDPKERAQILSAIERLLVRKIFEANQSPENGAHVALALQRIRIARAAHAPDLEGKHLTEILRAQKRPVTLREASELLIELVKHGDRGINHTLDDRPGGDVERVMQHAATSIASDGGVFAFGVGNPHPRSYGCYPRVFRRYVRERRLLTIEQAVFKMTSLPAKRLGWTDRGRIARGCWADLVVFDPQKIGDRATFAQPHRHSVGVHHVLVRGQFVLKQGKLTGILPGAPVGLAKEQQTLRGDSGK